MRFLARENRLVPTLVDYKGSTGFRYCPDTRLLGCLKTGNVETTLQQRKERVSSTTQKPESLDHVDSELVARFWEKNENAPGQKEDCISGEKCGTMGKTRLRIQSSRYERLREGVAMAKTDF